MFKLPIRFLTCSSDNCIGLLVRPPRLLLRNFLANRVTKIKRLQTIELKFLS